MLNPFDKVSAKSLPREIAFEIICGDCAGEAILPIRTKLTSDGLCADCGGRSFVPASPLCEALAKHLRNQRNLIEEEKENEKFNHPETAGSINAFIN